MDNMERATPAEIEPVIRRMALKPIDWTTATDGEWWTAYRPATDDRAEQMREFDRIRKSAQRWAAKNGRRAEVRRESGSVFVRMVA